MSGLVAACDGGGGGSAPAAMPPAATPAAFYASQTYEYTQGIPAQPLTPANTGVIQTGAIKSWSITPALPEGLSFDTHTGTISGTPTTNSATSAYGVTAVSSAGKTYSANLSIGVTSNVLLNLGHVNSVQFIQFDTSRVLSEDATGYWLLWDYATATQIASGLATIIDPTDGGGQPVAAPVALAGPTAVIQTNTGLELRSSATGTVAAEINMRWALNSAGVAQSWWRLASDGSYVCAGNNAQLSCWSPSGQSLFTEAGNYAIANVYASPSALLVAMGPRGHGVIETVATVSWTSSVGPAFQGAFSSWFVDGSQFLTATVASNTVYEYSLASVLEGSTALPSLQGLTGQGNWIWTNQPATDCCGTVLSNAVTLYAVGSSATPAATFTLAPELFPIAKFIAAIGGSALTVVDLSGATPVETSYTLPIGSPNAFAALETSQFMGSLSAFAAISPSQFMVGTGDGVVTDASIPGAPRIFNFGAVTNLVGSTARAVFTTASGSTFSYESATNTVRKTIDLSASQQLALSSDGSILATLDNGPGAGTVTVNIYAMPAGNLINSFPYSTAGAIPVTITLSGGGTVFGELMVMSGGAASTVQTVQISGGAVTSFPGEGSVLYLNASPQDLPMQLSPDGTLAAISSQTLAEVFDGADGPGASFVPPTADIYQNGKLLTMVPGYAAGWLANSTLLVDNFAICGPGLLLSQSVCYTGANIYSPAGAKLATSPFPDVGGFQVVTSDLLFVPTTVASLTTGASNWQSADPSGPSVFAGSAIVFVSGHLLVVQPY